ncbi:MAG TPA: ATP-binding protein [Kofleriaceae bacterium]|nr:ATP-binding protein [Kofleriaceae bacterium]
MASPSAGAEDSVLHLVAAIEAATRGDLRRALQLAQLASRATTGSGEIARLGAAIHALIQDWQNSIREKEGLLAELQLSQAEVEEMNDRLRGEIEDRKRAETQLASLQAELVRTARAAGMSEVATGVLHNIGNVLNSINVASVSLRERIDESRSERAAQAAAMLVDRRDDIGHFLTADPRGVKVPAYLLALARHQTDLNRELAREADSLCDFVSHVTTVMNTYQSYGSSSSVLERLAIAEIVEAASKIMRPSFERHGIELACINTDDPRISTDRHKVLQIVINLLSNARDAVRAMKGDRRVEIRVESSGGGRARISVCDNGVGICREDLAKIFGYGYTTKPDGHGFGLHTSANAARELGGYLHSESQGLGLGATFVLELADGTR